MSKKQEWKEIENFTNLLQKEEFSFENNQKKSGLIYAALYAFYHYFNADVTKLEDVFSGIIQNNKTDLSIDGIFTSLMDDESVDFISFLNENHYKECFASNVEAELKRMATEMAYVIVKTPYNDNEDAIDVYTSLNSKVTDDNYFTCRIICDFDVSIEEKIDLQRIVSSYAVKQDNFRFELLFDSDIREEIDDVENPKEYVPYGELELSSPDSICYFGTENSFLTMVNASSIKQLFYDYGNKGLFDSNLRFFISSKKIDPKIVNTIQNEPENFCYYNNGIIVTCDDYSIEGNLIKLQNFSVVNGGQTTNLIGRTDFEYDFPVICKVIKSKYAEATQKIEFLSNVAEASNTQKPINAKDLIANRKEQRLLKIQFARVGIFLRVKRGERIDKSIYKAAWQNASNDEIAQFIYSMVFQCPGSSKNSKSKLLETDKIYKQIFGTEYKDNFFLSIQFFKVAYSEWVKRLKKTEAKSSVKYALAKNSILLTMATYGLIYKATVNDELNKFLMSTGDISNNNSDLKLHLQINDIGQTSIFKESALKENKWNAYFAIFELLFGDILIPAYEKFKKSNPTYAYSHFVKSDTYYYNFVIPQIVKKLSEKVFISSVLIWTVQNKVEVDYKKYIEDQSSQYKPGLDQELIELRRKVYHESNKEIQAYEVISNRQLASVMRYLPKTLDEMSKCGFKSAQLKQYGEQILSIIQKYTNVDDMV